MSPIIAFLGAGNMGTAIISALLGKEVVTPENLRVCDRDAAKLAALISEGIRVSEHAEEVVTDANYIFLAVKPQDAGELLVMLNGSLPPQAVFVSIAAGLNMRFLRENSGLKKIIRVMPNMPALVSHGVSGMYSASDVSQEEREQTRKFLECFGIVIDCGSEEQIDAITALSASGPGYFFRILEIVSEKAEQLGFSKPEARLIALETLRGAGELAKKSGEEFSILREKITSKGGTTEAGLKVFAEQKLDQVLEQGIEAAFRRAKELGG